MSRYDHESGDWIELSRCSIGLPALHSVSDDFFALHAQTSRHAQQVVVLYVSPSVVPGNSGVCTS